MKYTIGAAIAVGVLASTSTAISAAATHSEGQSPESVAAKESYVVVDSDKATVGDNGAIFYPTGEIESDTLVIIPDGDGTVGGVAVREVVSALDSGGTEALRETFAESAEIEIAGAPDATVQGRVTGDSEAEQSSIVPAASSLLWSAPPLGYSPVYEHTTSMWGWDETARISYLWGVTSGSNQHACATGRGYYRGDNGSEFGVWSQMYGIGCAGGGQTSGASVPWGEVIALPAFRAGSTSVHFASGTWRF